MQHLRKWIAIALLLAGIGQLVARGVRRGDDLPLWDFTPNYIATHNWLHGGNPYDIETIRASWRTMTGSTADVRAWWSVYPPTMFVLLTPIGLLPPGAALATWSAISIALLISAMIALVSLAGMNWRDARAWIFIGGVTCAAPTQFGLLSGQPSVAVLSLAFIAVWCIAHARERTAGVLLALAAVIKPQVAAPFLLYYLVLRNWRVMDLALLVICSITAIAMIAMSATGVDVISGWSANLHGTITQGGVNDVTILNPWRDQMIHLPVILQSLMHNSLMPRITAMCLTAVLLGVYVRCLPPRDQQMSSSRELLAIATLGALSLLPVYHRIYDAMILCPAFAWALAQLDGSHDRRRFAMLALVPLAVFLVPFNALNSVLNRVPDAGITEQWWWNALLVPHYSWAVLFACATLLIVMWRARPISSMHELHPPRGAALTG